MKKLFIFFAALLLNLQSSAQTEYSDLQFESQTSLKAFKPKNRNYAFIRSKKGSGGLNKNDKADSVSQLAVTEIVLVYTEMDAAAQAEREEANRERWSNLLITYPEYFDYSPTLINFCQCNSSGDSAAFKKSQGFYIYFEGEESESAPEPPAAVKEEKKPESRAREEDKPVEQRQEAASPKKEAESAAAQETAKTEPKKEREKPSKKEESMDEAWPEPVASKPAAVKKTGFSKPKRSKDPKACRPPCYENGDEDLNAFFRDNITLSKKQKKKNKTLVAQVRIQLNFDGSIKAVNVTGANTALNDQVSQALKRMNLWNAAVKNGLTVKSEVRMTLRYDKETKSMKPAEMILNPKPSPKCKCVSDEELFGSD